MLDWLGPFVNASTMLSSQAPANGCLYNSQRETYLSIVLASIYPTHHSSSYYILNYIKCILYQARSRSFGSLGETESQHPDPKTTIPAVQRLAYIRPALIAFVIPLRGLSIHILVLAIPLFSLSLASAADKLYTHTYSL